MRDPEKRRASKQAWAARNPDRNKAYQRKYKYGITQEEFDALLVSQDGRCAICRVLLEKAVVDHDHDTGRVRGLLCWNCNVALGHMRDDPDTLARAIAYLERAA